MSRKPTVVDLDPENLPALPCCGVKNVAHPGRIQKNCWVEQHFAKGLRAKVLLTPDNRQCGYIEYLPGEFAWRGVEARGYMFIHCIWTFHKEHKGKGHASELVNTCIEDARKAAMAGVAVLTRDRPWLAGPELFRKAGFQVVDTAAPDYQLLAVKFDPSAANPRLKAAGENRLKRYGRGLTIIRSNQCPHIAKFAGEIARSGRAGIRPHAQSGRTQDPSRSAERANTLCRVRRHPQRLRVSRPPDQPHPIPEHHEP